MEEGYKGLTEREREKLLLWRVVIEKETSIYGERERWDAPMRMGG